MMDYWQGFFSGLLFALSIWNMFTLLKWKESRKRLDDLIEVYKNKVKNL